MASQDPKEPWTDYVVTSQLSGKTYRVALRGEQRGESYCSCPDFRVNTLGTCKHILYALQRVKSRFSRSNWHASSARAVRRPSALRTRNRTAAADARRPRGDLETASGRAARSAD